MMSKWSMSRVLKGYVETTVFLNLNDICTFLLTYKMREDEEI